MSRGREDAKLLELAYRLSACTDVRQTLEIADDLLGKSLSADYSAMLVAAPGQPSKDEWHVLRLPPGYFRAYPEMYEHDFVRPAAERRPNVVVSTQELVSREQLHQNGLYRYARELGVKLEDTMAVMLDPRAPWYGGYVLYREGRTPFSKREQRELQRAVPLLTGAVHRACLLRQANARGALFEALVRMRGAEVALLDAQGRELWRTPGVEALLYSHFSSTGAWEGGLPAELAGLLARLLREEPPRISAKVSLGSLTLTFVQLPPSGSWAIVLEDVLPAPWRGRLSRREAAVAAGVLQGWDTKLISSELGCSVETVKKHLQAIYRKLVVPGRAKLIALARDYTAL